MNEMAIQTVECSMKLLLVPTLIEIINPMNVPFIYLRLSNIQGLHFAFVVYRVRMS